MPMQGGRNKGGAGCVIKRRIFISATNARRADIYTRDGGQRTFDSHMGPRTRGQELI